MNVSCSIIDERIAMFNKCKQRWVMIWNKCAVMHSKEGIYILYPSAEISAELSFVFLPSPVHYLPAGRK